MRALDFGFRADLFDAWVLEGKGAPIPATRALYRFTREHNVAVFFISGRPESRRQATARNLEQAGYRDWTELFMKPDNLHPKRMSEFESQIRRRMAARGYALAVNLGDQQSDLEGGGAGVSLKLPNPFYYVP